MITNSDFSAQMVKIAEGFVGEDRVHDHDQIAKFLAVEGLPFSQNGIPVPFCASFVTYCALKAYCLLAGISFTPDNSVSVFRSVLPKIEQWFHGSASVAEIVAGAKAKGNWLPYNHADNMTLKQGWLIVFNWHLDGHPDHIGIVMSEDPDGEHVQTLEGNTSDADNRNGGAIAYKTRAYGPTILGYIRVY